MKYLLKNIFQNKSDHNYGSFLFHCGVFFLPSSLFLGILFLLPAAIKGCFLNKKSFFRDRWNYPFLIFGIIIFVVALLQNFYLANNFNNIWDPKLSIIGLGNWLPFIWLFWAFQPYLDSQLKRKKFASILIASSFPVLITGFGQYFFNWTGPLETLNGLIIWYQRPIEDPGGLSGLFNHQNYAGSWLNFVWPFCLVSFMEKANYSFRKIISFIFLFSVGFSAFLTFSRNSWIGLLTSLSIITRKKVQNLKFIILPIFLLILILTLLSLSNQFVQDNIDNFLPNIILQEFSEQGYAGLDATRSEIFSSAIDLIKASPLIGTGAASFSHIFNLETGFWKGHSHNLLLELSISYGIPAALIFFATISFMLTLSGKFIFLKRKTSNILLFDEAFWVALLIFMISQLFDIQYFDGRISIMSWILISALKNIIDENNSKYFCFKKNI